MVVDDGTLDRVEVLSELPPLSAADLLRIIQEKVGRSSKKIVVLDDDPTGTQTVYDTPVLTEWSISSLTRIFNEPAALFYILTNSRSLPDDEAALLMTEIVQNLNKANTHTGREYVVVSRSDSTLRGHFDAETTAIMDALPYPTDGVILAPFFEEGGRFTIHDVHYVQEGDRLVPASETEFASDKAFGYHASNLRDWVEEKTHHRIAASEVCSISLEDLRLGGVAKAASILHLLYDRRICVANAAAYSDLEVLVLSLLEAEEAGKHFLYRTAASFVRTRAGLAPRGLWCPTTPAKRSSQTGGLIVAGSYVQKSTRQLASLMELDHLLPIEVDVNHLLNSAERMKVIDRSAAAAEERLRRGEDVLIYTSRSFLGNDLTDESLKIGQSISNALVDIARKVNAQPAWIVTKGGITSSDVATKALGIKRATVLGQIEQGVPVWQASGECRWPGLLLVIFPGNVGGVNTLRRTVEKLRGSHEQRVLESDS